MIRVRLAQQESVNKAADERRKKQVQEKTKTNTDDQQKMGQKPGMKKRKEQRIPRTEMDGYNPLQPWTSQTTGYR